MFEWRSLFLVCAAVFLAASVFVFFRIHSKKKNIIALGLYFCSVLFINYSSLSAAGASLSGLNTFFSGIINALQTFSLDAQYGDIVNNLQDNTVIYILVFGVLALAPILGGAVLLAVIADLFPALKFWFYTHARKKVFLFSFLNEQSLNMAKELLQAEEKQACVVFANAWVEEGNEDESNLVSCAEEIGAICLKKDLSVLKLPRNKVIEYYFARDDELRNLDDAIRIASEAKAAWGSCKQVSLYVFAQNDTAYRAMEQIHSQMEPWDQNRLKVIVVPFKTNTVYRLLYEEPLYQCLSSDPAAEEPLDVVIVGSDSWAEELYRVVYWCGQMPNKQLRIASLCEDAAGFEQRIRFLIPELDSEDNGRPYCLSRFLPCKADTSELEELLQQEGLFPKGKLSDARIWFVCTGDSQKNLEIAAHLKSRLSALQLFEPHKTMIHYQMDSDHLKETLNRADKGKGLYRMHAFASALDQYSLQNIRGALHKYAQALDGSWKVNTGVRDSVNEYNRRSSFASALYLPYRLYAFGLLGGGSSTAEAVRQGLENYRSQPGFQREHAYAIGWMEHRRWNAYTRALGYRKVSVADWKRYYDQTEEGRERKQQDNRIDTKDHARKLHTCLTEYRQEPTFPEQFLENFGEDWQESPQVDQLMRKRMLDELDRLSVEIYRMGEGLEKRGGDIKVWDTKAIEDAAKLKL